MCGQIQDPLQGISDVTVPTDYLIQQITLNRDRTTMIGHGCPLLKSIRIKILLRGSDWNSMPVNTCLKHIWFLLGVLYGQKMSK